MVERSGLVLEQDITQLRGTEFSLPDQRLMTDFGNTFVALLSMPDQHYSLAFPDMMQYRENQKTPYKAKRCPACLEFFTINTKLPRKRAFAVHDCPESRPCHACGDIFSTADALKKHRETEPLSKCPYSGCETSTHGDACADAHDSLCYHRPTNSRAQRCKKCKTLHTPETQCISDAPHQCPACRIGLRDDTHHRCFLSAPAKPKGRIETIHYAADFESVLDIAQAGSETLQGRYISYTQGTILDHLPILWQVRPLNAPALVSTFDGYDGQDVIGKVIGVLFEELKQLGKGYDIAVWHHNGAKYDTRLIQYWLEKNMPGQVDYSKSIIDGTRPKVLDIGKIRFMDSYLHLAGALTTLPKTLGLDTAALGRKYGVSMRKGIWPYRFTTTETLVTNPYIGPVPDISWYDTYKEKDKEGFQKRYDEEVALANGSWDQRKMYLTYLNSDTLILACALKKYQELMLEAFMVDPLLSPTLPAACLKAFRTHFMPQEVLPVIRCFPKSDEPRMDEERFIRKALKGGKTDLRALHVKLSPDDLAAGWRLAMVDFVSLYPSVMYNHAYPAGNLIYEDWTGRDVDLNWIMSLEHEGVVEIDAHFPTNHPDPPFHPVLWSTVNGKFAYTLLPVVKHTYCLPEVRTAVSRGYIITKVYRSLIGETVRSDIFNSFVTRAIGGKIKASPPSRLATTDPELYRQELKRTCGVVIPADLPPKDWHQLNTGLRSTFKLCANSLFGKMCQNPFKDSIKVARNPIEEEKIWTDALNISTGRSRIKNFREQGGLALYTVTDETPSNTLIGSCVILGAYITAYGRTTLWDQLNLYREKVLYHDTDSLIILLGPHDQDIHYGEFLGQLTDELGGKRGIEFASLAPKTYCLKQEDGKIVKLKAKGIVLSDTRNSAILHFDRMVEMACAMEHGQSSTIHTHADRWIGDSVLGKQLSIFGPMKKTTADHRQLKGQLSTNGLVYPFGAEKYEQWKDVKWVGS